MTEENEQILIRKQKLAALKDQGVNVYPNDFSPSHTAAAILTRFANSTAEELEQQQEQFAVAGRIMSLRHFGKAAFFHIQDRSEQIQAYVRQGDSPQEAVTLLKESLDVGDYVGVTGSVFRTRTGELTLKTTALQLLSKSLRPLPEKWHGLQDIEVRYRQRYLDLIVNPQVRTAFQKRAKLIQLLRQFFIGRDYLEVETPVMQSIAGGALARPFVTHHNTLDIDLYLRIAPELFLKRLIVGGTERVFELGRMFRNEGMSTKHNPEYTMLEFYQAYADYHDLMDLTEEMLRGLTESVLGRAVISYQGATIDFARPFVRMTLVESVLHFNSGMQAEDLTTVDAARRLAQSLDIPLLPSYGLGKIQLEIFEKTVEHRLQDPTFITAYPTEVSPLARRNDDDPFLTDRFEFFVAGREIANGFTELNDAEDQAERFRQQVAAKSAGDEEAMHFDADYIRALEHGMPPTAGEGIGIDRLVMLLTDSSSIRDVLLFPHMRPE